MDQLRTRDALASLDDDVAPLSSTEALEAIALSEVLIRKASYGRQLDVRAARQAGAPWTQIGAACRVSKQAAWEAHDRWISGQAELHWDSDHEGLEESAASAAQVSAGQPSD